MIFDWGGTLTPWHTIDHEVLWHEVCQPHFPAAQAGDVARAIYAAERAVWEGIDRTQVSATLAQVFDRARVKTESSVALCCVLSASRHSSASAARAASAASAASAAG